MPKPKKVTRGNAIQAKCHDCSGHYADGKQDCEVPTCPLYEYMPFRTGTPDYDWTLYSPRRVGKVKLEDIKVNSDGAHLVQYQKQKGGQ